MIHTEAWILQWGFIDIYSYLPINFRPAFLGLHPRQLLFLEVGVFFACNFNINLIISIIIKILFLLYRKIELYLS